MKAYHITYSPELRSANIHFDGCNFDCQGCIRKKTMYNVHLEMEPNREIHYLSLEKVLETLENLNARKAILCGGEPTTDPELPVLTEKLHDLNISIVLLTNGYELNERLLENLSEICVSIKAFSDRLHRKFTGRFNKKVLKNFRTVHELGVSLSSESIYIPNLIEVEEIKKIAKFISSVSPKIPYHIDAYVPIDERWRTPTSSEIKRAAEEAMEYLQNVTYLCGNEKLKYEVYNVI